MYYLQPVTVNAHQHNFYNWWQILSRRVFSFEKVIHIEISILTSYFIRMGNNLWRPSMKITWSLCSLLDSILFHWLFLIPHIDLSLLCFKRQMPCCCIKHVQPYRICFSHAPQHGHGSCLAINSFWPSLPVIDTMHESLFKLFYAQQ